MPVRSVAMTPSSDPCSPFLVWIPLLALLQIRIAWCVRVVRTTREHLPLHPFCFQHKTSQFLAEVPEFRVVPHSSGRGTGGPVLSEAIATSRNFEFAGQQIVPHELISRDGSLAVLPTFIGEGTAWDAPRGFLSASRVSLPHFNHPPTPFPHHCRVARARSVLDLSFLASFIVLVQWSRVLTVGLSWSLGRGLLVVASCSVPVPSFHVKIFPKASPSHQALPDPCGV